MTERHGGQMVLRTVPAAADSAAGNSPSRAWRESRNGLGTLLPYPLGAAQAARAARAAREQEVADQVAAIRAEALRNVRARLGPGPLYRRIASGWVLIGEDEGASS